jgi:hypothetical protein
VLGGGSPHGRSALVVLASAYLLVQFATLGRSPIPWFDETFNASITDSLIESNELRLRVSPLWFDKPVYIYGPAYFAVTSLTARIGNHEMFFYRIPGLMFALGVIALVWLILRKGGVAAPVATVLCVVLALDPTFYKGSHAGRMDSMALFFVLLSYLALPPPGRGRSMTAVGRAFLSGAAAAVAMLTTPRPAYLVVAIAAIMAFRAIRERTRAKFMEAAVWSVVAAFTYGLWLSYAFGSVGDLISYYASVPGSYRFYLFGFRVRLAHIPILVSLLALTIAVPDKKELRREPLFFVAAGLAGFYGVIREPGLLYSFFMVVVAYLGIGYLSSILVGHGRAELALVVLLSLLTLNASAYAARHAFVLAQWRSMATATVDAAIAKHIPVGSRVVGDDKYYYAVRKAGSDFQYLSRGGTPEERVTYHRDCYGAEYVISESDDQSALVQEYARNFPLIKVGTIPEPPPGVVARLVGRLANAFRFGPETGYGGSIWARTASSPRAGAMTTTCR